MYHHIAPFKMNNWHGKDTKKDWNSQENLKENG